MNINSACICRHFFITRLNAAFVALAALVSTA
jgi:hypothetical protein